MRIFLIVFAVMLALPLAASANCGNEPCTCGGGADAHDSEAGHSHDGHAEHAHAGHGDSMHAVDYSEAPAFDGTFAPETVTLEPVHFVVQKGTIATAHDVQMGLAELVAQHGLKDGQMQAWSIVPEMPMSEEAVNESAYWAARAVSADTDIPSGLETYVSPGGKYWMAVHRGPYERLGDTWSLFVPYVIEHGAYDAARPLLEHYHSDPGSTPAEELVTLLYIPVK